MSNKLISTVLNLSRSQVQRSIVSVKKQLMKYFVPHFVGFQHIDSRDVIQSYTRPLAFSLFGRNDCSPPAILVLDGTYIYINKSSNNKFQRRTYSVHKKRSLVKPMMIVSTSGYIVSVIGPFLADGTSNDASILNTVLENNVEMVKDWVHNGDIFVVDRGLQDSLDVLEKIGIDAKMPSCLPKGNKQLGTTEANVSRLVTKVRWVVESANARLKQWRLLDKTLPASYLPSIGEFVRIVCALCNKYKGQLSHTEDPVSDIALGTHLFQLSKRHNDLKLKIDTLNESKQLGNKCTTEIREYEFLGFPKLTEEAQFMHKPMVDVLTSYKSTTSVIISVALTRVDEVLILHLLVLTTYKSTTSVIISGALTRVDEVLIMHLLVLTSYKSATSVIISVALTRVDEVLILHLLVLTSYKSTTSVIISVALTHVDEVLILHLLVLTSYKSTTSVIISVALTRVDEVLIMHVVVLTSYKSTTSVIISVALTRVDEVLILHLLVLTTYKSATSVIIGGALTRVDEVLIMHLLVLNSYKSTTSVIISVALTRVDEVLKLHLLVLTTYKSATSVIIRGALTRVDEVLIQHLLVLTSYKSTTSVIISVALTRVDEVLILHLLVLTTYKSTTSIIISVALTRVDEVLIQHLLILASYKSTTSVIISGALTRNFKCNYNMKPTPFAVSSSHYNGNLNEMLTFKPAMNKQWTIELFWRVQHRLSEFNYSGDIIGDISIGPTARHRDIAIRLTDTRVGPVLITFIFLK
ncbi:hypothetical protein MAR_031400 [Mya arenaria]|uniref:DDE Tnp4 domain-containing protein n=1 Tax=Mya arenaria TaxID=6604 RepID=A0ABY7F7N1_MYAAR|nr:hypothetical protein MAR_031400 [Mya arenaria]